MLKLKFLHIDLVRKGKYEVARRLLHFIIDKRIKLGLGDVDYELEQVLRNIGINPTYTNFRSGTVEFKIH